MILGKALLRLRACLSQRPALMCTLSLGKFDKLLCKRSVVPNSQNSKILSEVMETNRSAMTLLKQGKFENCYKVLLMAEAKLKEYAGSEDFIEDNEFNSTASVTYNNIGCYYQKKEDYHTSLKYLQKALKFNKKIPNDEISQSSTHLNICACFSCEERHEEAYKHAKYALKLLPIAHKKMKQKLINEGEVLSKKVKVDYEAKRKNLIMTLVIAYHNAGVESEYLKKYDESEHHFLNGSEVGLKYFGKMDEMTRLLQRSLAQIKRVKAAQSVKKWKTRKKSPTDMLSMTSDQSREKRLHNHSVLKDSSSEDHRLFPRSSNRSPSSISKPQNKTLSQERLRMANTRKSGNISVMKKSHKRLISHEKSTIKISKKAQKYIKARKDGVKKAHQGPRINIEKRSNSKIDFRKQNSLSPEGHYSDSPKLPKVGVKEDPFRSKGKLYKIPGKSSSYLKGLNSTSNPYLHQSLEPRPNQNDSHNEYHTFGNEEENYMVNNLTNRGLKKNQNQYLQYQNKTKYDPTYMPMNENSRMKTGELKVRNYLRMKDKEQKLNATTGGNIIQNQEQQSSVFDSSRHSYQYESKRSLRSRASNEKELAMERVRKMNRSQIREKNYSNLSFNDPRNNYESLNDSQPLKPRKFKVIEERKKGLENSQNLADLRPRNYTQINMNISYDSRDSEPKQTLMKSNIQPPHQMIANMTDEEPKSISFPKIEKKVFAKRGIEDDIVIEDPNEQTYSEFHTKGTAHGANEKDRHKMVNSINHNNESPKPKNKSIQASESIMESNTPGEVLIKKNNPSKAIQGKYGQDRNEHSPIEKSVSLSFSSKYPEDDESRRGMQQNSGIIDKIGHIQNGLDTLNNNISRFETHMKNVKDMGIDLQTKSGSRNISTSLPHP
ncbi:unnamed protein product [Moneuplotes crassus]|uniref:Uncharacterized protein n=1 Tax=Euplotes crassus TaxID=5936 RepID=A0AAD1XVG0_EUPCR|nr:unnamed protein product [Moneuplotes crassus]